MKHNREYKKLGDVCVSKSGIGRALKTFESNDEILYIDIASIDNQKHSITSYTQTKLSEAPSRAQQCVKKEDILVSLVRPNLKNVAIVGDDENNLVASSGFCVLRAGEDLLPQYVFQFVCSDKFTDYLVGLTAGANYPAVREDDVRNAIVPIPPLSEQSRIVAELDLLTGIIDKQNAQLKELDNLAQAIFYDMFGDPIENPKGWDVKNIGDIADVKIGPFGSLLHASDYINGGHPVINPVHLKAGKIIAEDDFTVNDDMYAQMMSYVLHKNDIVFGRRGDIGRCALVSQDQDGYLCGTGSLFVRFNIHVQPLFSIAALMQKSITDFLLKKAKGATMLNINCGIVENIPFILPPLALQQSFAEKIQSIEKQKETIRVSIADTQKLLDYTMDKYFG